MDDVMRLVQAAGDGLPVSTLVISVAYLISNLVPVLLDLCWRMKVAKLDHEHRMAVTKLDHEHRMAVCRLAKDPNLSVDRVYAVQGLRADTAPVAPLAAVPEQPTG